MADDRNEWLDQVTAERLMRGEPVCDFGELGEPARAEAARLAGALRSVAAPEAGGAQHPGGELPGEAAALAAFRAAAAGGASEPGVVRLARRAPGAVRESRRPRRGGYRGKLSAPFRLGVVAVVAGFAFGGVAVASGADFLPSPFDGAGPSATGTSVSAGPGELPDATPRTPAGPAPEVAPPGMTGTPSSSSVRPVEGTGIGAPPKPGVKGVFPQRLFKACREYRAGAPRPQVRALLERMAKGPAQVPAYCGAVLGAGTDTHPGAGGGVSRGSQGQANGAGNGKGKGNGAGNANGGGTGKGKGNGKGKGKGNGGPGGARGGLQGIQGGGVGAQDSRPGLGNGNANGHGRGGPPHHRGGDLKAGQGRGAQSTTEQWGRIPGRTDTTSGSGTGTGATGSTGITIAPAELPPTMLV
ncbi:hypothetical protein ACIQ9E_16745 [Streptomyces sp. NPDC094448]|uniref:hypothetical protein n=1 Tax=Streptomyces sp. NPDC094448 TaxID=3366063 RepID=UPI0037F23B52